MFEPIGRSPTRQRCLHTFSRKPTRTSRDRTAAVAWDLSHSYAFLDMELGSTWLSAPGTVPCRVSRATKSTMRTISALLFGRLGSHDSMRVRVARARSEEGKQRRSIFLLGVTSSCKSHQSAGLTHIHVVSAFYENACQSALVEYTHYGSPGSGLVRGTHGQGHTCAHCCAPVTRAHLGSLCHARRKRAGHCVACGWPSRDLYMRRSSASVRVFFRSRWVL